MKPVDIEVKINSTNENRVLLEMIPVDFSIIDQILIDVPETIKINHIHAVIHNDGSNHDDIYINESTYLELMGDIRTISGIKDFFINQTREYTINKLQFECGDINVYYDDDALLVISLPEHKTFVNANLFRGILKSLLTSAIP